MTYGSVEILTCVLLSCAISARHCRLINSMPGHKAALCIDGILMYGDEKSSICRQYCVQNFGIRMTTMIDTLFFFRDIRPEEECFIMLCLSESSLVRPQKEYDHRKSPCMRRFAYT